MDDKLKAAAEAYRNGCTCSQAVFSAYTDEMGLDGAAALRLMEGFGGGLGGQQEACGALTAATAVIGFHESSGVPGDMDARQRVYGKVSRACELFRQEYGGLTCRDVMRGEPLRPQCCPMKVKDAVLIIERVLKEQA